MTVILASASRTRLDLLTAAGLTVTAVPAQIDEETLKQDYARQNLAAEDWAQNLADAKALKVAAQNPTSIVIGADQILQAQGECFSKPGDRAEAYRQLWRLRGQWHRLLSGVSVAIGNRIMFRHVGEAQLHMRSFSAEFIEDYLNRAGTDLLQSVGAYRIEAGGIQLFDRIEGDYFTILGIPLLPLLDYLRQRQQILS